MMYLPQLGLSSFSLFLLQGISLRFFFLFLLSFSFLFLLLRSGFCVLLFFLLSFSLSANSFGLLCIGLLMALLAILPWFLCFAFLRLCLIGTASFNEIGLMGSSDRALLVDV